MKLRQKILLLYIVILLIVGLVVYHLLLQSNQLMKPVTQDIPSFFENYKNAEQLDSLAADIRYYDEVLTQAARNYAFTQNSKWVDIYKAGEKKLDAYVKEAIQRGDDVDRKAFNKIDISNQALVKMEYQSMALVDSGRVGQARQILESRAYWTQKEIYKRGLEEYAEHRSTGYRAALAGSTSTVQKSLNEAKNLLLLMRGILFFACAVFILIAAYVYYALWYQILAPIIGLSQSAENVSHGNLDIVLPVSATAPDAISVLTRNFNQMVFDLKKSRNNLSAYADNLAAEVKARTEKLTQAQEATLNILEDLTEAKNKLETYAKKLEEALRVKAEFTSMVSHEMRTPLSAIKEGIGLVADGTAGPLNDNQKEFLSIAKRNVDRLHRLINDILDFAKLEARRADFVFTPGDIVAVVDEAVKSQKALIGEHKLNLQTNYAQDLPKVKFDVDRITQVMVNLLSNAIKFTEKGGITVTVGWDEARENIKVAVADTGLGIEAEDFPKLFLKFQQLGKFSDRKTGGSGLGLAICREIIEQHHGKIWVKSEIGKGSEFLFTLPLG